MAWFRVIPNWSREFTLSSLKFWVLKLFYAFYFPDSFLLVESYYLFIILFCWHRHFCYFTTLELVLIISFYCAMLCQLLAIRIGAIFFTLLMPDWLVEISHNSSVDIFNEIQLHIYVYFTNWCVWWIVIVVVFSIFCLL